MLFMVHPQLVPSKTVLPGMTGNSSSILPGNSVTSTSAAGSNNAGSNGGTLGGVGASQTGGPAAALKAERYRPRIFGFMLHETAQLHRWQEATRDSQISRLEAVDAVE